MKILLFIERSKITLFWDLIKNKYNNIFPKFVKYFKANYFEKFPFKNFIWNYDIKSDFNSEDFNNYFFTNNICESSNRTINMNYKGSCKTLLSFECVKPFELT